VLVAACGAVKALTHSHGPLRPATASYCWPALAGDLGIQCAKQHDYLFGTELVKYRSGSVIARVWRRFYRGGGSASAKKEQNWAASVAHKNVALPVIRVYNMLHSMTAEVGYGAASNGIKTAPRGVTRSGLLPLPISHSCSHGQS